MELKITIPDGHSAGLPGDNLSDFINFNVSEKPSRSPARRISTCTYSG